MTTPDPQRPEVTPGDLPPADADLDRDHQALLDERDELRTKVKNVEHTRTRATFIGLVIGAVITVLLLVFILQNLDSQRITLIFWEVNLPLGVSLLIAAIAGALIVALAGGLRMLQMSRAMRKAKK
ncbi:LapA family protein [Gordonia sp. DT218]|uniref:LapA family protein n=1 Tax=unclassified Gordonia (in: high G+C Gram-positive bacteria) TaxID=2657482 RepID=UPI003CE818E0